jgi:transcriptional antiterminator NusG
METKWYVVRAMSGKEKAVKESLDNCILETDLEQHVRQIVVPWEKVVHMRNGKKVSTQRNHFPGYILAEIEPNIVGELQNLFKNINYITGFLGGKNPVPLRPKEVERMLGKMDELDKADEEVVDKYFVGEKVKIVDGPFKTFVGTILEVDESKKRLKVNVKIFGRDTELELGYLQIGKDISV